MVHMPSFADSMHSGWSKGAAGLAALLLAGAGASSFAGAEKRDERGTGYRATDARTAGDRSARDAVAPQRAVVAAGERRVRAGAGGADAKPRRGERGGSAVRLGGGDKNAAQTPATNGGERDSGGGNGPADKRPPSVPEIPQGAPEAKAPAAPSVDVPVSGPGVQDTVDAVSRTLPDVNETVQTVAPQLPVTVPDPAQVVPEVTAPVTTTVDDVVDGLLNP